MECRVLSIQSHVVRGYVGNKSASFPLQVNANCMLPLSDTTRPCLRSQLRPKTAPASQLASINKHRSVSILFIKHTVDMSYKRFSNEQNIKLSAVLSDLTR